MLSDGKDLVSCWRINFTILLTTPRLQDGLELWDMELKHILLSITEYQELSSSINAVMDSTWKIKLIQYKCSNVREMVLLIQVL